MRFTTEDGREVSVGISHEWTRIPRYGSTEVRQTVVWLRSTWPTGGLFEAIGKSICSPEDNFSKKIGRELARDDFFDALAELGLWDKHQQRHLRFGDVFSRNDRRMIYRILLPEYHAKKGRSAKTSNSKELPISNRVRKELEALTVLANTCKKVLDKQGSRK